MGPLRPWHRGRQHFNRIWTWILVWSLSMGHTVLSYDSCGRSCTTQPHLPCVITPDCASESHSSSVSSKVVDLQETVYYKDRPYLNLTWRAPEIGYMDVKGFQVKVIRIQRNNPSVCRTLSFTGSATLNSTDVGKLWFYSGCINLDWESSYTVYVSSLPALAERGDWASVKIWTHKASDGKAGNCIENPASSAEWCAGIMLSADPPNNQLTVTFSQAPAEFRIWEYGILLTNRDYPENRSDAIIKVDKLERGKLEFHTFDICIPGVWKIYVEPRKLDYDDSSNRCRNEANYIDECRSSSTTIMYKPDNSCVPPYVMTGAAHLWAIILGICVGCFLTSIFVAIVILKSNKFVCNSNADGRPVRRQSGGRYLIDTTESNRTSSNATGTKRQVLMLYSDDNEHHREAVAQLGSLLRNHCDCDVIIDDGNQEQVKKNHMAWLLKHLDTSEKIILVHSEGGFKKFHAKQSGDQFRNPHSSTEDLFTPAVEMLIKERSQTGFSFKSSQNTVSVFLPYTPSEFVIQEASPAFNYSLMRDMDSLVYHIHNLPRDDPAARHMVQRVNLANYQFLPSGKLLDKAIEDNRRFLDENPGWFEREHIRVSIEGSADSGRGTLQERVPSWRADDPDPVPDPPAPYIIPDHNANLGHVYAELPELKSKELEKVVGKVAQPDQKPVIIELKPKDDQEELESKRSSNQSKVKEGSRVAMLRQSFEASASADSGLNLVRENIRNKYRKNKTQSATSSQLSSLDHLLESEETYARPMPRSSHRSSQALSATSDIGPEIDSRPNSKVDPLYAEVPEKNKVKPNSLRGSIKDYSQFVDDAFGDALSGQSIGEPES